MLPKTMLLSTDLQGTATTVNVTLTGQLTTGINLAGNVPVNVSLQGSLTTGIPLQGTIVINVGFLANLFAAKKARGLSQCGHPMFTKCERHHLGEES